ncbi:MAG: hypothetical protein K2L98_01975, partial [Bacilli bacterium]|nr:hypothetical protein [Bacilli bacterium]
TNVLAYNATVSYPGGKQSTGVLYSAAGNSQKTEYKQRRYEITYGGKVYDAYCLDPDLHGAKLVTCSPYNGDAGIIWLLQQFKGISDNNLKLLTFRMYGVYKDLIKTTPSQVTLIKQSIIRFLETKDGIRNEFSQNPYDFLSGNTALIDQAYSLASTARKMSSGGLDEASSGMINVGKKSVNGLTATYPLTSNAVIKPEYIDFECENCTILNKQWGGTSGTVTVAASECNKEYKLNIVYKKSETSAYICSNGQKNTQSFLMFSDDADDEVKVPYPDKVSCDGENCCTENPIEPGWIGGSVNNCCEDGGNSEAHEYDLDQLFCRDKDLEVDYYAPKCKTDYYVQEDTTLNEKYCKMYCTERVSVEIPGPITAVSGRYFQLTQTSHGTKSPYIEGFKRCRIRVQYDVWEEDYYQAVKKQIKGYNDFQYNEAYKKMYEDAIKKGKVANQSETSTISCKAECTVQYEDSSDTSCNGQPCKKTDTASDSKSEDCTIRFNRYN